MANLKNIPALRFPEFKGEWENMELKAIAEIYDGTHQTPNYVESGIPFYSVEHLTANNFQKTKYISKDIFEKENKRVKLEKGDILMTRIGDIGTSRFIDWEVNASFYVSLALIKKSKKYNTKYLNQYISTKLFQNELWNRTIHVAFPKKINLGEIGNCRASFPKKEEQTKIATFLTSVDQKRQSLKQKLTLLEQYKKGVMQKIFSEEIRFKDDSGKEYPKWEKKKLGDIGETYNGLSGKTKENFGQGKPYIQYKQIFDDSKLDITRFEYVDVKENENQNKVEFGDVFFTISSETPSEIGTASVLLDKIDELYLNSFCFGYRAHSLKVLSPYFSKYIFRSESFRNDIVKLAQGSTRYNMSKIQLMKLEILLPSLPEQTKIANFLSAIDKKIEQYKIQIEKTEQYKKGLLQLMFC